MPHNDAVKKVTLAEKALSIAITQEGVSEEPKGSNAGPEVTQYLNSVGLGGGYPWCMAFVYWCVNKAAAELQVSNPLLKTGGVLHQWDETKLSKLPNNSKAVKPGDIFIMNFGHGEGHTGFVEEVKNDLVITIEGNTNEDGSREGYEVAVRQREISSILGFIQLP